MQQDNEPSVEEILESIKKVIARDNRDAAQSERHRRARVGIPEQAAETDQADQADDDDDEVLELSEAGALIDAEDDEEEDELTEAYSLAEGSLTTESAASAMRDSLAALAMIAEPSRPPQIVRSGETSLEGLTRELLRPMLAEWLDANLPDIVERLVKKEISRIAGKKG